jgi:hypothetical protein
MPARSILSKHIPHLSDWSVSTSFRNSLGSRPRCDGMRPKRAARLILQSRALRWSNSFCCCCGAWVACWHISDMAQCLT